MDNRCSNCGSIHTTPQARTVCNETYRRRREDEARSAATPAYDSWTYAQYESSPSYDSPSCDSGSSFSGSCD